jgi:hypothetical protein
MLGTYSYNEIIRKTIIAFGTLFNEVYIKHEEQDGTDYSFIKVPIAYGPIQKFLARVEQKPDLKKRVAMTLPRMSFEMTSLKYDSSRKVSSMQTFKAIKTTDRTEQVKVFMPVPYNIGFQLSIMTKLNDDMLQIVEQILPAFQPSFSLTINLISSIGEKKDIPIILEGGVNMEDNYEGNYTERRALVYTLNFTAKAYLFGPIPDSTDGIIKKVQVDYYTDTNTKNASRQLRYTATPRALKDYNNDNTTTLAENIDDKVTVFNVSSAVSLVDDSYIMIGNEEMYIKNISGNILTVLRGQDDTSIESHIEGDSIDAITTTDNELVEMDDDFGFSESRFDFGDGKVYSTTKGIDVSL